MGRKRAHIYTCPWVPGGQNIKYHLISINFLYQTVCVLKTKRYNTFQTRLTLCRLGHAQGLGSSILRNRGVRCQTCVLSN